MPDTTQFYADVGARIRKIREKRGVTQETLGTLIGLSRASVINIEKGRQRFLAHMLVDIAVALHVGPDELLPNVQLRLDQELEQALANRPADEQAWIRKVVAAITMGED